MQLLKSLLLLLALLGCRVASAEGIDPYEARFGRAKPVIAVVGANAGTELSDFMAPYAILARAGNAELLALGTTAGPIQMRPALRVVPHATLAEFDQRFPDGADYVIVPAVAHPDDPVLVTWLAQQAERGATIVSICDGALTVARAGIFKGHRATGHWATHRQRVADFPDTEWLANRRFVADGKVVSSAGISAAIPTALALVEAISGRAQADAVAGQIGASGWSDRHDSTVFGRTPGIILTALSNMAFHGKARLGIELDNGMDELGLALYADAVSRTYRSQAYTVAATRDPVLTAHGLTLLPDLDDSARSTLTQVQRTGPEMTTLRDIVARVKALYGAGTAKLVATQLEYADTPGANF
jgi:putative intracellular protease/amidase